MYYSDPEHLRRQSEARYRREPLRQPVIIVDMLDPSTLDELVAKHRAARLDELKPFIQSTGAQLTFAQERHNLPPMQDNAGL